MQEAVRKIIEIMQPLAQVGVGLAQQARAGIGLHALHRGFRREARVDRLLQTPDPAPVMREHAEGFEHVAMLARPAKRTHFHQVVDGGAHLLHRGIEPAKFLLRIIRNEVLDLDTRLMEHDMAEAHAFRHRLPRQSQRPADGRAARAGAGERFEFAACHQLREDHRGGLQRLHFLFGIGALGTVLHHEHAERVAGAQDRHARERGIDLFARFRLVGEGRMILGIGQSQRLGLACDQADKALIRPHRGEMDSLAIEALCRVEFERTVRPLHIDRADLRHHVGGDEDDDLVEPRLRAHLLRHHLAEATQQQARSAERLAHVSRSPCRTGKAARDST